MRSPDATFVAMMKTPEAREIWEKVCRMRGLPLPLPCDWGDPAYWRIVEMPTLGELWALAKTKANFGGLSFCPEHSEAVVIGHDHTRAPEACYYIGWTCSLGECRALLSYLVGHSWDGDGWRKE